ncbi:phage tail protein [Achromobacter sp. Marseille-Q0513]|uniref:phage tail protein n=1 Tax=Achromobacter sp. Marseille-Q0513 TaxID=2829161 RepID=UPI001B9D0EEB|nr:phage tail protein [Achromobacter sp. Marseille-Q0513]MBR8655955.1 phage tail protein [Achromobacter sp. Marseille-Q0513]
MTSISVPVDAGGTATFKIDKGQLDQLMSQLGQLNDKGKPSRSEKLMQALQTFVDRAHTVVSFAESRIERFENAFMAARLAGTSGRELRALEAAGQEFGLSAEAMRNGVQALYRSVRDDPEAAAALRKQGISTHDDEGNQRSTADLARALSNVLQKLDGKQANELGKQLNLDASVIEALRNPAFPAQADSAYAGLEGSRVDAAGERAHRVMTSVREVGRQLDSVFAQAFLTMADKLEPFLQNVATWLKENGTLLGTRLGEVGNFFISILSGLGPLMSMFLWLDEATGGFSSQLTLALSGLLLLGGGGVIGGLFSLLSSLSKATGLTEFLGKQWTRLKDAVGPMMERAGTAMRSAFARMGNFLLSSGRAMAAGIGRMAANAWARLGTLATQAGSFVANGLSAVGRAVARTAESLWSRVTSWFGRASASLGELSGQAARVGARVGGGAALMLMPSELGDDQLELKKLHYRRANGLPLDGSADPKHDSLDGSVMQYYEYYVQPDGPEPARASPYPSSPTADRLSRMLNPTSIEPWQGYAPGFSGTGLLGLPAMPPAQPGVTSATVNANTTINVHGVSDPLAVGSAVANEQNRVNSDLARNTRGAME